SASASTSTPYDRPSSLGTVVSGMARRANAWITTMPLKNLSVFLTYDPGPTYSGNSSLDYRRSKEFLPEKKLPWGFPAATGPDGDP
ncbi:hypothetical protein HPP92_028345, partial [Vanilla planifolia]